ncbi:hypothetical protein [Bermanella sp. R86510]|uniref:hypothetical protein n=1 Tax=unclassified Bermanella TaxID=2627862 RepID=UPI0037CA9EB9
MTDYNGYNWNMLKRILTYLLMILIVFQSSLAMADAHQFYQSGYEHINFDQHNQDSNNLTIEMQNTELLDESLFSSQESDCQHCCHCHGHCPPCPTDHALLRKHSTKVSEYSEQAYPGFVNTLQRPPRI